MSRVEIIGTPFWAHYLSDNVLDQTFEISVTSSFRQLPGSIFRIFGSDHIILLGHGIPNTLKRCVWFFFFLAVWCLGPKRPKFVIYWIGSEVARESSRWQGAIYRWFINMPRVTSICGAPWFAETLRHKGISTDVVLFPYDVDKAKGFASIWLPEDHMIVSTYLTASHWENSNGDWISEICRKYPDVHWRIFGMSPDTALGGLETLANVELCGWVSNPQDIVSTTHLFIRMVNTDAYAGTVRDAQSMQRIVMYSKPVSDCIEIDSRNFSGFEEAFINIKTLFDQADAAAIQEIRSTGCHVPDLSISRDIFSDILR